MIRDLLRQAAAGAVLAGAVAGSATGPVKAKTKSTRAVVRGDQVVADQGDPDAAAVGGPPPSPAGPGPVDPRRFPESFPVRRSIVLDPEAAELLVRLSGVIGGKPRSDPDVDGMRPPRSQAVAMSVRGCVRAVADRTHEPPLPVLAMREDGRAMIVMIPDSDPRADRRRILFVCGIDPFGKPRESTVYPVLGAIPLADARRIALEWIGRGFTAVRIDVQDRRTKYVQID